MSDTPEKKFTPFDKGIKLVSKPSDLDPCDDDPDILRAVLSCGHVTDADTLTACCKAQLDDGTTEFKCEVPNCERKWPYDEVKKLGKLTLEEQVSFEEKLGTNTVKKKFDFRECPGCGCLIKRSDLSNLCVVCAVCTLKNTKIFQFCWQCHREWKGPGPRADRCDNKGCKSEDEELLRNCPMITLAYFGSRNVKCPKIRRCTSCHTLIEHDSTGCNNMECPECDNEFCFICLQDGHEFESIPCKLAPRQVNTKS